MAAQARPTGAPTWLELSTGDPQTAKKFYGDLFGWEFVDQGPDYGHYTIIQKDDVPVGALMFTMDETGQPVKVVTAAWTTFLATWVSHLGAVTVLPVAISACPGVLVVWFGALIISVESAFMTPFLRKVKTASGATAVQIVEKKHGQRRILEHLGSAHTEFQMAALLRVGRDKLAANQPTLDFDNGSKARPRASGAVVEGVIRFAWDRLGFVRIEDEAFFQLVLARLVEPTSKPDSLRVIEELCITPSHHNTYYKSLQRCAAKEYRERLTAASFEHAGPRRLREHPCAKPPITSGAALTP
ncbi:hypothetical protein [Kocuria sp.]|uniref:hypothetical protein n=1 Tax=Kocuria sp. TaxID=1871328 RepID=UPI0026E03A99|nr:hypothetical protein [Kocuria sp.]MDO5619149.1 hypothetical protein [Kocuria sp.]